VRGRLVSAAGVHVYSEHYRVAAIGNVVTHPAHRNRGYAGLVTARLCRSLLEKVEHVGLHVKADNAAALACYRKLGFEIIASYREFMVENRMMTITHMAIPRASALKEATTPKEL
jgi:predicted GNAT family acetyltransferase